MPFYNMLVDCILQSNKVPKGTLMFERLWDFFSDSEICIGKIIENFQSRLEFRDYRTEIFDLVSRLAIWWTKSHSRL